jgi:hypothetical protein
MAGYSETPLVKKLGLKPGHVALAIGEPAAYWKWISPLPEGVVVKEKLATGTHDFIHLFVKEKKVYEKEVLRCRKSIKPDGMIWISWPKRSSGVASDLDENVIRDFALKNGLVDIKVCAVDEVWSGLKLVIPIKDRKQGEK